MMIADAISKPVNHHFASEHKRDTYGFSVRPDHVQRYREYVKIYKEEGEERSDRWISFLEGHAESGNGSSDNNHVHPTETDSQKEEGLTPKDVGEEDEHLSAEMNVSRVQLWTEIRPSLRAIEDLMSVRVKRKEEQADRKLKP